MNYMISIYSNNNNNNNNNNTCSETGSLYCK